MVIGMNLAIENLKNTLIDDINKSRLPTAVAYLVLESLLHDLGAVKKKDIEMEIKDYKEQKGAEISGEALQPDILGEPAEPEDSNR